MLSNWLPKIHVLCLVDNLRPSSAPYKDPLNQEGPVLQFWNPVICARSAALLLSISATSASNRGCATVTLHRTAARNRMWTVIL